MWRLATGTFLWADVLSKEPYPNARLQDALPPISFVYPSVPVSTCINLALTGEIFMKFDNRIAFEKL